MSETLSVFWQQADSGCFLYFFLIAYEKKGSRQRRQIAPREIQFDSMSQLHHLRKYAVTLPLPARLML